MKKIVLAALVLLSVNIFADGYQSGWKVYDKPQAGITYGTIETNPYGAGGSQSYGEGGGKSYGAGGGQSYGEGGGKNASNPWHVADDDK